MCEDAGDDSGSELHYSLPTLFMLLLFFSHWSAGEEETEGKQSGRSVILFHLIPFVM